MRANDKWSQSSGSRGWYKEFMTKGAFNNNWSKSLDEHLVTSVEWVNMPFSAIMSEIDEAPGVCRQKLKKLMDRYWMAAKARLRDLAPYERYEHVSTLNEVTSEDVPEMSDNSLWGDFLGGHHGPEMEDVDERAMVLRMLAIQELKLQLFSSSEGVLVKATEPAVIGKKSDGRKKLTEEKFEKDFLPVIIDRLLERDYTNKKHVFDEIAKAHSFGGSTLEKRYNRYRDDPQGKLNPALDRYGYGHLKGKRLP